MTPEQIQLVRLTFTQITLNEAEAGRQFYDRFFTLAPDARALFKDDVAVQTRKLMNSLGIALSSLKNPGGLSYIVDGLGRRHARYGVRDEHYAHFRSALLWMFEKQLGPAFTPQAREAWNTLYVELSETMMAASRNVRLSAAV